MLVLTHPISTPGQLSLLLRCSKSLKLAFCPLDNLELQPLLQLCHGFLLGSCASCGTFSEEYPSLSRKQLILPADELDSLGMLVECNGGQMEPVPIWREGLTPFFRDGNSSVFSKLTTSYQSFHISRTTFCEISPILVRLLCVYGILMLMYQPN